MSAARNVERDITPTPGSGPKRRFVAGDAPAALEDNFLVQYFASLTAEQQVEMDASFERQLEAGERYGDDAARELLDLEAGLEAGAHPLSEAR